MSKHHYGQGDGRGCKGGDRWAELSDLADVAGVVLGETL
jgi:hypothetical protein